VKLIIIRMVIREIREIRGEKEKVVMNDEH
jgi:hypothetical protein